MPLPAPYSLGGLPAQRSHPLGALSRSAELTAKPAKQLDLDAFEAPPFVARPTAHAADMASRHLLTRAAFIEDLQQHAPTAWPAIWGVAYAHIEACLETAYAELERLLAISEMHRTRLKREMRQVLRLIAEEGP